MNDMQELIARNRSIFNGTLYTIKKKEFPPWLPSGSEGRFSGNGTKAYYFGDSPFTCWTEIQNTTPQANRSNYELYAVTINSGTFVDVGAVQGTRFIQPKQEGGWQPTQEFSNYLSDNDILGFRYASQPAIRQGFGGTCFCIYQSSRQLSSSEFHRLEIQKFV